MGIKKCIMYGCREHQRNSRGWCNKHYIRWLRKGSPSAITKLPPIYGGFTELEPLGESVCYRPITGYEGRYEIGSDGSFWSLNYRNTGNRHRLLIQKRGGNYPTVTFHSTGRKGGVNTHLVHRMMAIHFLPNPHRKKEVNHLDNDRSNFNLDNLEWVTASENQYHRYATDPYF